MSSAIACGVKARLSSVGTSSQPDVLAGAQAPRGRDCGPAVEHHMAALDQRLQVVARELRRQADQRLVQPLAMQRGVDDTFAQFEIRERQVFGGFGHGWAISIIPA